MCSNPDPTSKMIPILNQTDPNPCSCPMCTGVDPDEPTPEELAEWEAEMHRDLFERTPEEVAAERAEEERARESAVQSMTGRMVEAEYQLKRFRRMRKRLEQCMDEEEAALMADIQLYRACISDDDES
jgi:hypothetical protein